MPSVNRRSWKPEDKRYARAVEKRQQIMDAAQRVFVRNGYERTSMEAIALEAGVGKMTVYRQFADKPSLFVACSSERCREMLVPEMFEVAKSLEEARASLIAYGELIVDLLTQQDIVMLYRMLIGEANHFGGLGQIFYEEGPRQGIHVIERIIARLFDASEVRLRAQTFFWASLGDAYERMVLGVIDRETSVTDFRAQIEMAARLALG